MTLEQGVETKNDKPEIWAPSVSGDFLGGKKNETNHWPACDARTGDKANSGQTPDAMPGTQQSSILYNFIWTRDEYSNYDALVLQSIA
jgi:hypothetical protein